MNLFFKNLVRSFLMLLIGLFITFILTGILFSMFGQRYSEFPFGSNCVSYFIAGGIIGGIVTILMFIASYMFSWGNVVYDADHRYEVHVIITIIVLLGNLVIGVGIFVLMVLKQDLFNNYLLNLLNNSFQNSNETGMLYSNETRMLFPWICALISYVAVFELIYFLIFFIHYLVSNSCWKCGISFCIDKTYSSSSTEKGVQYKTDTDRVQVGSIKSGNTEIAQVYGDKPTSYYRDYKKTTHIYNRRCVHCNRRFSDAHELDLELGDWK